MGHRLGDADSICRTHGRIGATQEKLGNHLAALESLNLHLSFAEEIDCVNEQIAAMSNFGIALRSLQRYDEAAEYFEKQLRLSQEAHDVAGQINAYGNISVLYRKMGRHSEAMDMLSKQLKVADDVVPSNPSTPAKEDSPHAAPWQHPTAWDSAQKAASPENTSLEKPGLVPCRKLDMEAQINSESHEQPEENIDDSILLKPSEVATTICRHVPNVNHPEGQVKLAGACQHDTDQQKAKAIEHAKSVLQLLTSEAARDDGANASGGKELTTNHKEEAETTVGVEKLQDGITFVDEEVAAQPPPRLSADTETVDQESEVHHKLLVRAQRLARHLDSLCQKNDWNSALKLEKRAEQCVANPEAIPPRLALVIYGRLALAFEQHGSRLESAVDMHGRIIPLAHALGDRHLEAAACECKADGCISLQDYANAASALTRLLELLEFLGDKQACVDACAKLADVYDKMGSRIKMLDTIRKLLRCSERSGDLMSQGAALTKMAQALSLMGHFEEARKTRATARSVQLKAIKHYSSQLSSGGSREQAAACAKLATVYKELGRHTEAIDMRAKAKGLALNFGSTPPLERRAHPGSMFFHFDAPSSETVQEDTDSSDEADCAASPIALPRLSPEAMRCMTASQTRNGHRMAQNEHQVPVSEQAAKADPATPERSPLPASPLYESRAQPKVKPEVQRRVAGPTPESSPGGRAPQDKVTTSQISNLDDACSDPTQDMSKVETAVLELLRLCQEEEWENAAAMHGRMVPVAAKLAESEPRMALSIYGNLGFALESLAEDMEDSDKGTSLWIDAIGMHLRARAIACRSIAHALVSFSPEMFLMGRA